ncbi:hypothetical protein L1987_39352 [Smallanthus sonchifolius]|uniref:Uncharacterized protein n=1 Tax=Smallanthus sonchifolius TaxID=185202 RepID=A0ACB9HL52_9ASTR|nr:hypothetical protein L1987_39352 [Smallanthus sonchifolius]
MVMGAWVSTPIIPYCNLDQTTQHEMRREVVEAGWESSGLFDWSSPCLLASHDCLDSTTPLSVQRLCDCRNGCYKEYNQKAESRCMQQEEGQDFGQRCFTTMVISYR